MEVIQYGRTGIILNKFYQEAEYIYKKQEASTAEIYFFDRLHLPW